MRASSAEVAGRSSSPTTLPRTEPRPTSAPTFAPGGSAAIRSSVPRVGKRDDPSAPTTILVTPCRTIDSICGSSKSVPSPCECISTKPGATTWSRTSISRLAVTVRRAPIAVMRSPVIARSDWKRGRPEPSMITPPRRIRSALARCALRIAGAPPTAVAAPARLPMKTRRFTAEVRWEVGDVRNCFPQTCEEGARRAIWPPGPLLSHLPSHICCSSRAPP